MKLFPTLPSTLGNRKGSDFTHSHRTTTTNYTDISIERSTLSFLTSSNTLAGC